MIGRRGILGLLLGAPMAAPAAALGASSGMLAAAGELTSDLSVRDPLHELYNKHRRKIDDIKGDQGRSPEHMPWHISGKKSWSPAFKSHVFCKEQQAYRDNWSWFDESPETMIKALRSIGVTPPNRETDG